MSVVADSRRGAVAEGWSWPSFWLILAFFAVLTLYADHTWRSSLSIDGTRWFWLDDDQMISMRYARNLVEGFGLGWNPGERVEGYTNFGWTMIMAAVHMLALSDRLMPVAMTVVSGLICFWMVLLAARLLQRIEPKHLSLSLPVLLVCILTCIDVMMWATSGYETILVTALHLAIVLGVARKHARIDWRVLVPLALIPIVRSDGLHIWIGDAILVLWRSEDRRNTAFLVLLTLAPFAAHLAFRLAYYGDVMPNTYYLKVVGLDGRWTRGFNYIAGFANRYWLALLLAGATAASLWKSDPRARSILTSLAPPVLFSLQVGGDAFGSFRFFAHIMPEIFLWVVIGGVRLTAAPPARAAWLLILVISLLPPLRGLSSNIAPIMSNGDPFQQVVVAAQLLKNASKEASIAVFPAGIVPYFTRLKAVDLLGKNDPHVARLQPHPGALVGHGKVDPAYSFGKHPDYVISCRPRSFLEGLAPTPIPPSPDYVRTLLGSAEFQRGWSSHPVPDRFLLDNTAVYVGGASGERLKLSTWTGVSLSR